MMQHLFSVLLIPSFLLLATQMPSGNEVLEKVDRNMVSATKIVVSKMVIHGKRETRTIEAKSWQRGANETFTEYRAPAREKGTKMLKLKDMLWTYSPSTDRTILVSGHMLRQSVMGSDLSYEDMMDDPRLLNLYSAAITSDETVNGRPCWVVDLTAKAEDIAYHSRKIWVDKTRSIILRENLYAKSGKLLKTMEVRDVMEVQTRWVAKSLVFKDVFKEGEGTEFQIVALEFDPPIPAYIFSKAALKK